jgi:flavin reductase (DIM6/NTAB) family NADH-FMN oxidoreductase RutF
VIRLVAATSQTKKLLRPGPSLYPLPAVLVSSLGEVDGVSRRNILTIAWTGVACGEPPMVSVAVRPTRFSHGLIASSGEFVVNVPSVAMCRAVDLCGNLSGRDGDKFTLAGLTAAPASRVGAPLVAECPIALECRVRHTYSGGSHDLFVGEIIAVQADEAVLDADGKIEIAKVDPLGYGGGFYWPLELGRRLGEYGFSRK